VRRGLPTAPGADLFLKPVRSRAFNGVAATARKRHPPRPDRDMKRAASHQGLPEGEPGRLPRAHHERMPLNALAGGLWRGHRRERSGRKLIRAGPVGAASAAVSLGSDRPGHLFAPVPRAPGGPFAKRRMPPPLRAGIPMAAPLADLPTWLFVAVAPTRFVLSMRVWNGLLNGASSTTRARVWAAPGSSGEFAPEERRSACTGEPPHN
jgi:hypothetical protein